MVAPSRVNSTISRTGMRAFPTQGYPPQTPGVSRTEYCSKIVDCLGCAVVATPV